MKFFSLVFLVAVSVFPAIHQTKKPSATPAKPKATPQKSKAETNEPAATKPKPTPKKPAEDTIEWERIKSLIEPAERISAIKKFLADFPKTRHVAAAHETLAKLRSDVGNSQLVVGDLVAASDTFKAAASESPKPIPQKLFTETFSKFPPNLFFRGAQLEAYEIAAILEDRAAENSEQLLTIASFYVSAELGAEAKRTAQKAIDLAPMSAAGYQMAGLAHRLQFDLAASHAAFEKAVAIDANSINAKRGLAEAKRALGRSEEAVVLYREIVSREAINQAPRTGLILALLDAEMRAEAESLLDASLKATPDDVILLAGAAYWYASRNEGDKAVELGQKAVTANPRYVWSHIALGRGFMSQKKFVEADQAFVVARRFGNFPTLEYELASARASAGFFREAADILEKTFTLGNGMVETTLGGRVKKSTATFGDLIAFERRASIFAYRAADDPEIAARLRSLLEFRNAVATNANVAAAADKFVAGADKIRLHRLLFVASELLRKNLAHDKALDLLNGAPALVTDSLDIPTASAAVAADELYSLRALAAIDGQYLLPPTIAKETLASILRGRIEELNGWAHLVKNENEEAAARLKRSLTILPPDSAWSRSAHWHLGTALEKSGKNEEALEAYYKGYLGSGGDPIKYSVIESLYKRVQGSTLDLEKKIGLNPIAAAPRQDVQPNAENVNLPAPTPQPVPASTPVETQQVSTASPVVPAPEKTTPAKPLFEPIVIMVPDSRPRITSTPKPCTLRFSDEFVTLKANGNIVTFVVSTDSDDDLSAMTATPSNPKAIEVRREFIAGIKTRALFVLKAIGSTPGLYTVSFIAACGQKELQVKVV